MDESERLQRWRQNYGYEECGISSLTKDEELASRILALLNHADIDKHCMVDAYYYDFSVIPHAVQERLNLWRDCYLIFGITNEGDLVSKWVDRWDLDSDDPIVDGEVIRSDKPINDGGFVVPEIRQSFDPKLLSTPAPDLLRMFSGEPVKPIDNTIDMKSMDLCETCKCKLLAEFMKACTGSLEIIKEYND